MKELVEEYNVDGEIIRYTDQTGGMDWEVAHTYFAIILISSISFLQKVGGDLWSQFFKCIKKCIRVKKEKKSIYLKWDFQIL